MFEFQVELAPKNVSTSISKPPVPLENFEAFKEVYVTGAEGWSDNSKNLDED